MEPEKRAGAVIADKNVHGTMKPGQDLVAAGYIGLEGTSLLAVLEEGKLSERFTASFVRRCQRLQKVRGLCFEAPGLSSAEGLPEASEEEREKEGAKALEAFEAILRSCKAASWYYCKEGGVMAALWNYFEYFGLGFEMELRRLPILQETVEVCEVFDINPYRLLSGGCVLVTAENGGHLADGLMERGIHAAVIGRTAAQTGRHIHNGEIHTFLDRPKPDEIDKIVTATMYSYGPCSKCEVPG